MDPTKDSPEEEMFERKLKNYMQSTGMLFPETEKQVDAFMQTEFDTDIPDCINDPMAILKRGYVQFTPRRLADEPIPGIEDYKMAARNGKEISDDLKKRLEQEMEEDD
jgi:hypothetical protein